jgi:hypothetical protein
MTSKRRKWKNSQILSAMSACLPSLRRRRRRKWKSRLFLLL